MAFARNFYSSILLLIFICKDVFSEDNCVSLPAISKFEANEEFSHYHMLLTFASMTNNFVTGNSLALLEIDGNVTSCINSTSANGIMGEYVGIYIFSVEFYEEGILAIAMQKDQISDEQNYFNNYDFIFLDLDFIPIDIRPTIAVNLTDSVFHSGSNIYPHSIIILDKDLAMVVVNEYFIADTTEFDPDLVIENFKVYTSSFAIVDRMTSEILYTQSGFDIFFEKARWYIWISERIKSDVRSGRLSYLEIVHLSSLQVVQGDHWDYSLRGMRTFLMSSHHMDCIDLFVWNFESGDPIQFIWRMPHLSSPLPVLNPWRSIWDYVDDPLEGISFAHDLNTFYEEPKHFLAHDNGDNHMFINENGGYCPMTRAVEYKIEMHANGVNQHRATMVWSHPSKDDMPKFHTFKDGMRNGRITDRDNKCINFWLHHPFVLIGGSVRRVPESDYILISRYSIDVVSFREVQSPYESQFLIAVDQKTNEIVSSWNGTHGGNLSFKFTPSSPLNFYI